MIKDTLKKTDLKTLETLAKRLHRFWERCCDEISYNEDTGVYERYDKIGNVCGTVRDIETPTIKMIAHIVNDYDDLAYFLQTDPRGGSLYLYRPSELVGLDIRSCYSSRAEFIV